MWGARRLDLAQKSPGFPEKVTDSFPLDYVAPDIARLLTGDLVYPLLFTP